MRHMEYTQMWNNEKLDSTYVALRAVTCVINI